MNKKLVKKIESKIKEVQNALTLWTKNIENYHTQLKELTTRLNELKKQSKINKK